MLRIEGHSFVGMQRTLSKIAGVATQDAAWYLQQLEWIEQNIDVLDREMEKLDLNLSRKKLLKIRLGLQTVNEQNADSAVQIFEREITELLDRIEDELETRFLYSVSEKSSKYLFGGEAIGTSEVKDVFPNIRSDLDEAMFCFGFQRFTACVFHLMRAMEEVVLEIGRRLEITVLDKNGRDLQWGKVTANIKPAIDKLPPGADRDEWQAIHGLLYSVKEAWRNATMHPKQTYTEEEAEEVYIAVKSFIRRFAKKLS